METHVSTILDGVELVSVFLLVFFSFSQLVAGLK